MKKKILIMLSILVIIGIGTVIGYELLKKSNDNTNIKTNENISKVNEQSEDEKTATIENVEIKDKEYDNQNIKQTNEYRNIAILGVDARADSYDNTRSDCIIIASVNEETNDVKITSVYRDTYVYIEGYGFDKITHAYAYGGPELAVKTINDNLDIDIDEYIAINFNAFVDIVDVLGGISIDVTNEEVDYINKMVDGINSQTGKNSSKVETSGKQILSGVQALAYSRIRYTSGGDFNRTDRARTVLMATLEKAKTIDITDILVLIDKLLPSVKTNISAVEIVKLASSIDKYDVTVSIGWPYENSFYNDGVSYVVANTLESNVKRLHKEVFNEIDYGVSSKVKKYSEEIIEKTGIK